MTGYILLVEDNPDDAELAAHKLKGLNNRNPLVIAPDYATAVRQLNTTPPELVILDLKLAPGQPDGLDVLRYIRGHPDLKRLPVIVLTVSDAQADRIDSFRLGVNSYMRKPIEPMALFDAIVFLNIPWTLGAT